MRKPKSNSKLYTYLQSLGVLERGNAEEILNAKKEFRKQYLTTYKQSYRKSKKHFEIILTPNEQILFEGEAKNLGLTLPQLLKQSTLHYLSQTYMTPYPKEILAIKEKVYQSYQKIEQVAEHEKKRWFGNLNEYETLKSIILEVHTITKKTFENPMTIEEYIKQELQKNPQFIDSLKTIVSTYDTEITRT